MCGSGPFQILGCGELFRAQNVHVSIASITDKVKCGQSRHMADEEARKGALRTNLDIVWAISGLVPCKGGQFLWDEVEEDR